jgi:hypothetical protein
MTPLALSVFVRLVPVAFLLGMLAGFVLSRRLSGLGDKK